ncbi:polymorphic toxin-type HINT domain-containing protein [Pseudarcicella hirudinis]
MNKIIRYFTLILIVCLSIVQFVQAEVSVNVDTRDSASQTFIEKYIEVGSRRLNEMIAQNEANDLNGESYKNIYVIDIAKEMVKSGFLANEEYLKSFTVRNDIVPEKVGKISLKEYDEAMISANNYLSNINTTLGAKAKIYMGLNLYMGDVFFTKEVTGVLNPSNFDMVTPGNEKGYTSVKTKFNDIYSAIYNNIINKTNVVVISYGRLREYIAFSEKDKIQAHPVIYGIWDIQKGSVAYLPGKNPNLGEVRKNSSNGITKNALEGKLESAVWAVADAILDLDPRFINVSTVVTALNSDEKKKYQDFFDALDRNLFDKENTIVLYYDDATISAYTSKKDELLKRGKDIIGVKLVGENVVKVDFILGKAKGLINNIQISGPSCYQESVVLSAQDEQEYSGFLTKLSLGTNILPELLRPQRVQYSLYKFIFRFLLCSTNEANVRASCKCAGPVDPSNGDTCDDMNKTCVFVGGAVNGLIDDLDIVSAVEGLGTLSLGFAGAVASVANWGWNRVKDLESPKSWDISDPQRIQAFCQTLSWKQTEDALKVLPSKVQQSAYWKKTMAVVDFINKFSNNTYNRGWAIATFWTLGEAAAKIVGKLTKKQLNKFVKSGDEAIAGVTALKTIWDAEDLVTDGTQIVTKNALGDATALLDNTPSGIRVLFNKFNKASGWFLNKAGEAGITKTYDEATGYLKIFSNGVGSETVAVIRKNGDEAVLEIKKYSDDGVDVPFDNSPSMEIIEPNGTKAQTEITVGIDANNNFVCVDGINCFSKGTEIAVEGGHRKIEELKPGDLVKSYNASTGRVILNKVVGIFHKTASKLIKVFIKGDTITTTSEHPFYVNNTWLPAEKLYKGLRLLTLSGALISVDSVATVQETLSVYNFEVEHSHNYFVGNEEYLVHNACRIIDGASDKVQKAYNSASGSKLANALASSKPMVSSLNKYAYNAHHLIPKEIIVKLKGSLFAAIDAGFDFNGKVNGKWLKRYVGNGNNKYGDLDGLHTGHSKYNEAIVILFQEFEKLAKNKLPNGQFNPQRCFDFCNDLTQELEKMTNNLQVKRAATPLSTK